MLKIRLFTKAPFRLPNRTIYRYCSVENRNKNLPESLVKAETQFINTLHKDTKIPFTVKRRPNSIEINYGIKQEVEHSLLREFGFLCSVLIVGIAAFILFTMLFGRVLYWLFDMIHDHPYRVAGTCAGIVAVGITSLFLF